MLISKVFGQIHNHGCLTELVLSLLMSVKLLFSRAVLCEEFWTNRFDVIFFVICLTFNNLSGILDTTDTSFMQPCTGISLVQLQHPRSIGPRATIHTLSFSTCLPPSTYQFFGDAHPLSGIARHIRPVWKFKLSTC